MMEDLGYFTSQKKKNKKKGHSYKFLATFSQNIAM